MEYQDALTLPINIWFYEWAITLSTQLVVLLRVKVCAVQIRSDLDYWVFVSLPAMWYAFQADQLQGLEYMGRL